MASRGLKLAAVATMVLVVVAVAIGYLFIAPRTPTGGGTVSSTTTASTSTPASLTLPSSWMVFPDASGDVVDKNGKSVGDLGQPYADVASVSSGVDNGKIFFRFMLHGSIPSTVSDTHVTTIEYQVLLETQQNSSTAYQGWKKQNNFTPDYILSYQVSFDNPTRTAQTRLQLLKYSGDGNSWVWSPIEGSLTVQGGVGQDFLIVTCRYQDLSLPNDAPLNFIGRSALVYDGETYNDPTYNKSGS